MSKMNLTDANVILRLIDKVEELENKIALLEEHTDIDYEKVLEGLREKSDSEKKKKSN